MRVLFDTNVVLGVFLEREPYFEDALYLFSRVESGTIAGFVCATTVTTIYYLCRKGIGSEKAVEKVGDLLNLFEVAPVNRSVLKSAQTGSFSDFEDAVLYEAARHVDAVAIVTRNPQDFKKAGIAIYTPEELAHVLEAKQLGPDS